jgi:CRP/FNR family transcriptional regulator
MKNIPTSAKDKVGAGRNLLNRHEMKFKRGTLMFIEGELSTEMFIIRQGKIRILKQQGEKTIELAVLGPGSVLGELSLLDHQPRGATAQIVEDCTVTVVDEQALNATLAAVPSWLSNIIRLVVKRLRDTMARTSRDIVNKSMGGVIKLLLLLAEQQTGGSDGGIRIPLKIAKEAVNAAIGIGDMEMENVLLHLIFKEYLFIRKNEAGSEFIVIRDIDALAGYMNYLRAKQRGGRIPGEGYGDEVLTAVNYILAAGQKNGRRIKDNVVRIGIQQVEIEMNRDSVNGQKKCVDPDIFDLLESDKLLVRDNATTQSAHGTHSRDVFVYNEDALEKIFMFVQWLPKFKEEVQF